MAKTHLPATVGYVCFGVLADGTRIDACCRAPQVGLLTTLGHLQDAGAVTLGYGPRLDLPAPRLTVGIPDCKD